MRKTASTDSDGTLIGKVDYSPYGEPTATTALSRFGYAGEWVDETTGYSFLRARWFDAKTGSFLSEDPLVQMTQNAFGYTGGDPLTQIDPLGLYWGEDLFNKVKEVGKEIGPKIGNSAKNVKDWTVKNSGNISAVLTVLAVAASATGVAAPVGIGLAVLSSAFSAVSASNNFSKNTKAGTISGVIDAIGIIPGATFATSSLKLTSRLNVAKTLVDKGVKLSRSDTKLDTLLLRRIRNGSDNTGISMASVHLGNQGERKELCF